MALLSTDGGGGMGAVRIAMAWLVLAAFYWLLVGQVSVTEAVAAVIAVTVTVVFAALAEHCAEKRFDLHGPWGRLVAAPLRALVTDTALVAGVMVRAILRRPSGSVGALYHQGFRVGGDGDRDVGRRGLVTMAASLAPNGVVVRVQGQENVLLLHRLVAARSRADTEWPL